MSQQIKKALIRRARPGDAAAIARVQVESWQAAYLGIIPASVLNSMSVAEHATSWRRVLTAGPAAGSRAWVLLSGESLIGFASAGPTRDADSDPRVVGEVYTLYLLPAAWGHGLGAALLEAAEGDLARQRYKRCALWVLEANTRGRRFYELCGFTWDGARQMTRVGHAKLPQIRYQRSL